MSTLVLVTPAAHADDAGGRFTSGHVHELADRFDRVIVVTDPGATCAPDADETPQGNGRVWHTDASLETVLRSLSAGQPGAAVIIDGDVGTVERAGTVARHLDVPVLWWCDASPPPELQRETAALVDAVLTPIDDAGAGRSIAVGAGIDTRALRPLPLAARPPLRVLVLGSEISQRGLTLPLRALAEAKARGVHARLVLMGARPRAAATERNDLAALIADQMLTQSVDILDTAGAAELPELLQLAHAVLDIGDDLELDPVVLETMACGRAVLSSRPALVPMLGREALPLVFAPDDPASLAGSIAALADARQDELADLGTRLRSQVEREHSLGQWGAGVAAVVAALHER